jgi:ATP-binding cassette subfamily B protein
MAAMMPAMMLIMNLTTVIIVWVGAKQVSAFHIDIGQMMAYMQYAIQIIMAFLMLSMMFIIIPRAAVSAKRIEEVLEMQESVLESSNPSTFDENFRPTIEFQNVNFHYPGGEGDVLRNINFKADVGKTTALIGATGCGKTTIVNLIMRFYDVTSGKILIGDKEIRSVGKKYLRDKIGYVPQKSILFSGTIESNLKYADKNATLEMIDKAAFVAQATEFITAKEEGYKAPIAQGGTNISGGQKQRLSIARALVKNAPIYIFDDTFSALDLKTDKRLRAALKKETGKSTILLIAQRVSTIINADQIIVLDNGEIVGKGTHRELLKTCDIYYQIARSQLSEEELSI